MSEDNTDDAKEPDAPADYTEAIVTWATGLCWLKELNGSPKAQEQFNLYNAVLQQALEDLSNQPADTPLVWGKQEPTHNVRSLEDWAGQHLPATLG